VVIGVVVFALAITRVPQVGISNAIN